MATEHFLSSQQVSFLGLITADVYRHKITLKRNHFISVMVPSTVYFANIGSIKWLNSAAA